MDYTDLSASEGDSANWDLYVGTRVACCPDLTLRQLRERAEARRKQREDSEDDEEED